MFDRNTTFRIGDRIDTPVFTAEVKAVTDDYRPRTIRFIFHHHLESGAYLWVCSAKGKFNLCKPPKLNEEFVLNGLL